MSASPKGIGSQPGRRKEGGLFSRVFSCPVISLIKRYMISAGDGGTPVIPAFLEAEIRGLVKLV